MSLNQGSPQKMRLVALKNEADAKALKIIQRSIFLGYMGYTLMVPEEVFEAVGWSYVRGCLQDEVTTKQKPTVQ